MLKIRICWLALTDWTDLDGIVGDALSDEEEYDPEEENVYAAERMTD